LEEGKDTQKTPSYNMARDLVLQQIKPQPQSQMKERDLFSLLDEEEKKYATMLSERNGESIYDLVDGLDLGVIGSKVLMALAQILHEQSYKYGDVKTLSGLPESITHKPDKIVTVDGIIPKNSPIEYYKDNHYPRIMFKEWDFARRVIGKPTASSKDQKKIRAIIHKLDKHEFWLTKNGINISTKLLTINHKAIDPKTGARVYLIELYPIFVKDIGTNFVPFRGDTNNLNSILKTDMEMKLFLYLAEQNTHKKTKGYPEVKINRGKLYQRIAKKKSYATNPKRRYEDFKKAIEKMKDIGIITAYDEKPVGDGISYNCIFTLNKKWLTAEIKPKGKKLPPIQG